MGVVHRLRAANGRQRSPPSPLTTAEQFTTDLTRALSPRRAAVLRSGKVCSVLLRDPLRLQFLRRATDLLIRMDAILGYRVDDGEDYYALLGCDELSSVEQILAEFKIRALECHPDKHPEDPKAVETFQKLQKAKEILADEDSRARYDRWRRSRVAVPFEQWEALAGCMQASMHWAVRSKKDLMLEEAGQTQTKEMRSAGWNEQGEPEEVELGSAPEEMLRRESELLGKSAFVPAPGAPGSSGLSSWHLRFRWSADAPSELLRKFRNYEV
ncbi:dnaJ homolog subfamily C member 12 [Octodon degus]|uniref:DnaJ homolog subfamily C member 12 n=1 Tax=Octodon degus TaxID=10160 RepID=A0A6P3EU62_OCTDE|nr:dnaJ homolog subfamily C member 12 [Octodon degus]